jgi:DNA-binding GntR family transcriptional regulator
MADSVAAREADNRFKTSADVAYEIICKGIIQGELTPGTRLTRRGMAELTGVSIIPVIEALHRLENEGLVESEPHYGSHVVRLTRETIRDRFAMRLAIESQVARILARHHTERDIARLLYLSDELDNTERTPQNHDILKQRHYEFHLALAALTDCKSFVLALKRLDLFDLLHTSIATYSATHSETPRKDHHRRIVDAIATGDPDHAEAVARDHIYFSGLLKPEDV